MKLVIKTTAQTTVASVTNPLSPTTPIHDILTDPEKLLTLSDDQLRVLLTPYIPAARKALLPTEKPSKIGLHSRVMKDVSAAFARDPKLVEQLEALRNARGNK